ncbi:hypothetical protein, partial [Enterobacter cloacae]|uniref:hypothetical protein n=1 Tax=Enterobacter cloacae TaxID=550 RepID=UPI0013E933AF
GDKPATLAGKTLSFVVTNGDKAQQTQLTVGAAPQTRWRVPQREPSKCLALPCWAGWSKSSRPNGRAGGRGPI